MLIYPLLEDAMAEAGLQEVETYAKKSKSSLQQGPLWTCAWQQSRYQGHMYPSGGGNKTGWM